ncbi:MAG: aminopeptidase N [Rhodocyclaceae bacterium]|nr:aminopeptidase N [Rhodocyclaceae bacterium]
MSSPSSRSPVQRADYRPLSWGVESVELSFVLDAEQTVVRSRMQCRRNPEAEPGPLVLDGDGVELLALTVDGVAPAEGRVHQSPGVLRLTLDGDTAEVEVVTRISPRANTALSGLYESAGGLFTQCEAEGFRRISWFPDRPDVMARFTVTLEADAATYPVLLSNGNLVEKGSLPGGRHFARWDDPFPKPSYLFALVAGAYVALDRTVTTASGREVLLQVWVEDGMLDRAAHAMDSLEHALRWDETRFGLELDLDRYMIVVASDFNMGAMENKGLNIFNAKYVLAAPDTATDTDYENVESVVAHEYFHNWTGNRVTCRDWFQLTLKEGLTVFRDQEFSADMLAAAGGESARAVKRIDDVRVLRSVQFAEDAGPMAHPIRPDSYQEINNFYTATVYEKGAEVIRMLQTLLGREGFRSGMDLYFSYFDGQAVTCDDFVDAMSEATGVDLDLFMGWYGQSGTPRLRAEGHHDAAARTYTLQLAQHTPATTDQADKQALHIPVAVGLIGPDGTDLPLRLEGEAHDAGTTRVLALKAEAATFTFVDVDVPPVPSLLRGASAPVILELDESDAQLAFRMAHDSDPFNRWDASQRFMERVILGLAAAPAGAPPEDFLSAWGALLGDTDLDPGFVAQALSLPGENYLLERMSPAEPQALRAALQTLMRTLGARFAEPLAATLARCAVDGPYRYHPTDAGRRALAALALRLRCAAGLPGACDTARAQHAAAANMTDRMAALGALMAGPATLRDEALSAFRQNFDGDALVLDKWLAIQASAWRWHADDEPALERVAALYADAAFDFGNPNRIYSLLGAFFRANPAEFHRPDGAGYQFWADRVIELDGRNPQVAARMARSLDRWRNLAPTLQAPARVALERVAGHPDLSGDVAEVIGRALA